MERRELSTQRSKNMPWNRIFFPKKNSKKKTAGLSFILNILIILTFDYIKGETKQRKRLIIFENFLKVQSSKVSLHSPLQQ